MAVFWLPYTESIAEQLIQHAGKNTGTHLQPRTLALHPSLNQYAGTQGRKTWKMRRTTNWGMYVGDIIPQSRILGRSAEPGDCCRRSEKGRVLPTLPRRSTTPIGLKTATFDRGLFDQKPPAIPGSGRGNGVIHEQRTCRSEEL